MFLQYTSVDTSTNSILLAEPLNHSILQGEDVRLAIRKNAKTIKPRDIREYKTNRRLEYYNFQDIPLNTHTSYTIKPYKTDEFITFDNYVGNVIVPTIIKPTSMVDDKDECILPDNYGSLVVAPLVAGWELKDDQQTQKGDSVLLEAYNNLVEMYNFYCKPVEERQPKVKVKPMILDIP
jgi:hypothetical protein